MIAKSTLMLLTVALLTAAPAANAQDAQSTRRAGGYSDALPYYNRGNRYLTQGRYDDAVRDFQQAIEYYPEDPDFFINLGVALRKLESYSEAEQSFRTAAKLNPNDWVIWSNIANACLKQNRLKETIANFKKAMQCGAPAKERAAMEQDIADINKILKMQSPPPVAPNTTKGETAKGTSGTANPKANGKQAATSTQKVADAAKRAVPGQSGPQDAGLRKAVITDAPAGDGKSLQDSGWDYTQH